MAKVLMLLWTDYVNDARVQRSVRALIEEGHNIKLICLKNKSVNLEKYNSQELAIKPIGNWYSTHGRFGKVILTIQMMIQMIWIGMSSNFDVIHANDLNTMIQAILIGKFKRKKIVYDNHEVQFDRVGYNKKIIMTLEKRAINASSTRFVTTESRQKVYNVIYPQKEFIVLRNLPEMQTQFDNDIVIIDDEGKQIKEGFLLYQGGLSEERGLEELLKALLYIENEHLVFLGDGRLKEKLRSLRNELGLSQRVSFVGKVPYNVLFNYTAKAKLGFQLLELTRMNHQTALSNKLFEYFMCGVPVIVSRIPEIEKIVNQYDVGVVVNDVRANIIAEAVNNIVQSQPMILKYKENLKDATREFNWEKEKQILVREYNKM